MQLSCVFVLCANAFSAEVLRVCQRHCVDDGRARLHRPERRRVDHPRSVALNCQLSIEQQQQRNWRRRSVQLLLVNVIHIAVAGQEGRTSRRHAQQPDERRRRHALLLRGAHHQACARLLRQDASRRRTLGQAAPALLSRLVITSHLSPPPPH